jgi:hypothetical protein
MVASHVTVCTAWGVCGVCCVVWALWGRLVHAHSHPASVTGGHTLLPADEVETPANVRARVLCAVCCVLCAVCCVLCVHTAAAAAVCTTAVFLHYCCCILLYTTAVYTPAVYVHRDVTSHGLHHGCLVAASVWCIYLTGRGCAWRMLGSRSARLESRRRTRSHPRLCPDRSKADAMTVQL